MLRRSPLFTLFPYTTLFRSRDIAFDMIAVPRAVAFGQEHLQRLADQLLVIVAELGRERAVGLDDTLPAVDHRSEEHTSELQSLRHLVCRLLLEKKNASESAS